MFSHRMIFHGRRVCHARTPACGACGLAALCPSYGLGPTDPERGRAAGEDARRGRGHRREPDPSGRRSPPCWCCSPPRWCCGGRDRAAAPVADPALVARCGPRPRLPEPCPGGLGDRTCPTLTLPCLGGGPDVDLRGRRPAVRRWSTSGRPGARRASTRCPSWWPSPREAGDRVGVVGVLHQDDPRQRAAPSPRPSACSYPSVVDDDGDGAARLRGRARPSRCSSTPSGTVVAHVQRGRSATLAELESAGRRAPRRPAVTRPTGVRAPERRHREAGHCGRPSPGGSRTLAAALPHVRPEQLSRFLPPEDGGAPHGRRARAVRRGRRRARPAAHRAGRTRCARTPASRPSRAAPSTRRTAAPVRSAALREAAGGGRARPGHGRRPGHAAGAVAAAVGLRRHPGRRPGGARRTRSASSTRPRSPRSSGSRSAELVDPAHRLRVPAPERLDRARRSTSASLLVWGFTAGLLDRLLALGGWERPWDQSRFRELDPSVLALARASSPALAVPETPPRPPGAPHA